MKHFEMDQGFTLMVSPNLMNEIAYLHSKNDKNEWCGMLFYEEVSGSIFSGDLILRAKHIYLLDVGTSAYTSGSVDLELLDFFEEVPEAEDMRRGFIHTHHGMKAYFSGTDMSELYDNTKHYDYYLSLIVNHATTFVSKISMEANIGVNGTTLQVDNPPILTFDGTVEFDIPVNLAARQIKLSAPAAITTHKNPAEIYRDTPFEDHINYNLQNQLTIFEDSAYVKQHELDMPDNTNPVYPTDGTGKNAIRAVKAFIGMENSEDELCPDSIIDCLKPLVVLSASERDVFFDTGMEEDLFNSMAMVYNISGQNFEYTDKEIQSIQVAADEMFTLMSETFPEPDSLHEYPFIQEVVEKMFEEVASLTF